MSLNENSQQSMPDRVTEDERALIADFLNRGGKIQVCQPANCVETETIRSSNDTIIESRKQYRAKSKGKMRG